MFLWLGIAWFFCFSIFFNLFALPNNRPFTRFDLWEALPELVPVRDIFTARWLNLTERGDLIGIAFLIVAGAWGLGQLAMRVIRPPIECRTADHAYFAFGLGLSAVPLLTLGLGLAGLFNRWLFIGIFAGAIGTELVLRFRERRSPEVAVGGREPSRGQQQPVRVAYPILFWTTFAVAIPFLVIMFLGSMTPEVDFDVRSYHFEGPKEYFQSGRITFLPHNMYTNFPFLTEMFALLGMVLHGDWYWGAIAGKTAMFAFAPLTALGLFCAGRRWFSPAAGFVAVMVYVSTPWIDRVTGIALAEGGLTYFLFATSFAVMIAVDRMRANLPSQRAVLLAGVLAGSGMGCKYTGLMQVVLPAAAAMILAPWLLQRHRVRDDAGTSTDSVSTIEPAPEPQHGTANSSSLWRAAAVNLVLFGVGVFLTAGPWLLKNLAFTGNPVYPLAYNIFGGRGWSPELNANLVRAHSPANHYLSDLFQKVIDVMADNDWSSALLFGLAPVALLTSHGRRISGSLWLLVGYLTFTYWAFTHRIDRFWMPMIPVVALLAGIGAAHSRARAWVWCCGVLMALSIWFNLGFICTGFAGYNALLDTKKDAVSKADSVRPYIAFLNQELPEGAKVLYVGGSEVFDARFPVVYNTVFNKSIFEQWFAARAPGKSEADLTLKPAKDILATLHAAGITHVCVDWDWVCRYREPGNYGGTDFETADHFDEAVKAGILGAPVTLGQLSEDGMSENEVSSLEYRLEHHQPIVVETDNGRSVRITGSFGTLEPYKLDILKKVGLDTTGSRANGHAVLIRFQLFPVR